MAVQIAHTRWYIYRHTFCTFIFISDCRFYLKIDDPGYKRKQVYVKSPML